VTVTTINAAPVADAGMNQTVAVGAQVYLQGNHSSDADGGLLSYQWSLISQPPDSEAKLSGANAVGASFVADRADPVAAALRAMGGTAPDVVFECVGAPGLVEQAVKQVGNRGTVLLLGLCTQPDSINTFAMLAKEVRLVTSAFFTRQDFEASVDVLEQGAVEPRMMISGTVDLAGLPATFEALKRRTHQCKVLVAP